MLQKLRVWFANHNIGSHQTVAAMAFAVSAYISVPQFHDLVDEIAQAHKYGTAVVALFVYAAAKYSHGHPTN